MPRARLCNPHVILDALPSFLQACFDTSRHDSVGLDLPGDQATVLGVLKPISGTVRVDVAGGIGYVPHRASVDDRFPATVEELVRMARWPRLGPGKRLTAEGFTARQLERLRGPIGLAIGSNTPEEIAVSVAAQILKLRRE